MAVHGAIMLEIIWGAKHVNCRMPVFSAIVLMLSLTAVSLNAQDHEQLSLGTPGSTLASTPPMGWNSWNKFACNVSEDLIR